MLTRLFWLWRRGMPAPAVLARGAKLHWKLFRHARTPRVAKVLLLAVALYVVSPIDLVPAWILVLGQLDDIGLLLWSLWLFRKLCPEDAVAEVEASLGEPGGLRALPPPR